MFVERTIVVSEYIGTPLSEQTITDDNLILRIFYQIANAINHIHDYEIIVQNIEPKNILIDENENVKLFNYGLYHQTNFGELVTFPIG